MGACEELWDGTTWSVLELEGQEGLQGGPGRSSIVDGARESQWHVAGHVPWNLGVGLFLVPTHLPLGWGRAAEARAG